MNMIQLKQKAMDMLNNTEANAFRVMYNPESGECRAEPFWEATCEDVEAWEDALPEALMRFADECGGGYAIGCVVFKD